MLEGELTGPWRGGPWGTEGVFCVQEPNLGKLGGGELPLRRGLVLSPQGDERYDRSFCPGRWGTLPPLEGQVYLTVRYQPGDRDHDGRASLLDQALLTLSLAIPLHVSVVK
ncbi:hypothetical protein NDU88_000350 [Pleurodeles waltl]|uniref:Uncharacterized protein n=1 Tax=Pleurodeles waltl TaxID=8319 RepID=A0AAV7VXV4_PLEWA|nr:hypothetical protein NDU88_000350 [Pleurodeles waltl]